MTHKSTTSPGPGGGATDPLPGTVADWFARATWHRPPWTAGELASLKGGRRVAVVLPALDEAETVGGVVSAFLPLTRAGEGSGALVDEILVMDSGSTDDTAAVARAAGARVVARQDVLPGLAPLPGKGEVMWRALAATDADLVVYADADLVDVDGSLVVALLGPLLTDPGVGFVKAFYDRPLRIGASGADDGVRSGGGRVTELLARPAIARFAPELAGVIQPLGGEYAARTDVLRAVPFASGYAVEIGLLLDVVDRFGLDALAQVDVGVRKHRHRDLLSLGRTATEILLALASRRGEGVPPAPDVRLVQFDREPDGHWTPESAEITVGDRPPMAQVLGMPARAGMGPSAA
ncbi:MAG: glucosyl-3-phosphoglycerate synthase [Kineosporiaceae bacterium]